MKNANFSRKWCSIKYKFFEIFKEHKKITLIFILIALVGFLTGIFAAIKYQNGYSLLDFNDFSLTSYLSGDLGTSNLFYSRLLSTSVVSVIVLVSSFSVYLFPVSLVVLLYRAYLLSLNCTIIILFNGLGGIVCALLIVLPCQLISLFLIIMFCSYAFKYACAKRRYGVCNEFKIWNKFLIFLALLLLVNLIETFLLYIFSSKIILVI